MNWGNITTPSNDYEKHGAMCDSQLKTQIWRTEMH